MANLRFTVNSRSDTRREDPHTNTTLSCNTLTVRFKFLKNQCWQESLNWAGKLTGKKRSNDSFNIRL
ncbi:hypothetical protein I79_007356 [Cricetulus griseus]|uniref:Uncharacterized protein n=1 Tax=Cricetulus griseus TaxID=10029 RepID=G3HAB0_CRIGR|nr:hypothetical protein I79_007356 [Cricetulus griseus]